MRVKTGVVRKRRHNKILKRTKGFRMSKGKLYKVSKEADLHAGQYAFIGRKKRKRDFRRLWIQRINAGLSSHDLSYSQFIHQLKEKKIELNRKIMAELAISEPAVFEKVVQTVKKK
ncbi:50S ribosomal protein L20 [Patescibacteria group bacterium]